MKYLTKTPLKSEGFILPHSLGVTAYHAVEGMALGTCSDRSHSAHIVKQRENDASTQFASSFLFSSGLKFIVWNHPHAGWVFSHQSNLLGNALIFIHRDIFLK